MKILVLTSSLPYPTVSGAKVRIWHLLREINGDHEVTLLALNDSSDITKSISGLNACCTRLELVTKQKGRPRTQLLLQGVRTIAKGRPPQNAISHYPQLKDRLTELLAAEQYDIVHFEDSHMAPYVEVVPKDYPAARAITMHNVTATQYASILGTKLSLKNHFWALINWWFLHHREAKYLADHFDACITVSDEDAEAYRKQSPSLNIVAVPNGVDVMSNPVLRLSNDSKGIVFVGKMNYEPNIDGAQYFCREVFPLVQRAIPDARLSIVGSEPTQVVKDLAADPSVVVTGRVDDIVPFYEDARLAVVPIRAGSGTRLKILESMALGRPVVSTSIGCEGLAVTDNENILIADRPEEMAAKTIRVLSDDVLWRQLTSSGRSLVERVYDWRLISPRLMEVYDAIAPRKAIESELRPNLTT